MRGMLTSCALLLAVSLSASQDLPEAFRKGDVGTITSQMASTVQICHLEDVRMYSRSEASTFLNNFFSTNDPLSYKVVHNGSSRGSASYSIGQLDTSNGSFRVYVYFENSVGDKQTIRELRIERETE